MEDIRSWGVGQDIAAPDDPQYERLVKVRIQWPMVPVDHPEYHGFDLNETDHPKTPPLRQLVKKLERCDVEAPYECYQVTFYSCGENQTAPSSQAELVNVPKAKRAQIAQGSESEGVDCTSPEDAVKTWLNRRAAKRR